MHCPFPSPLIHLLLSLLTTLPTPALAATPAPPAATPLNLVATALVTTPQNTSALQCWEFAAPFAVSTQAGTVGAGALALGNVTNVVYTVIPPRFEGGPHTAPVTQLVIYLSGLVHITLPDTANSTNSTSPDPGTDDVWIYGGGAVLVAADTRGSGHVSTYPGDAPTVALQVPFAGGRVPAHAVVGEGPCRVAGQVIFI